MVLLSIKGGSIIHVGNNAVLLDRLQTGGPGTVNIKRTTIYELGNYKSVGQVSDIPDLSFSMDSLDVSCSIEALLLDADVKATHSYDLSQAHVLNVKSAFLPGAGAATPFGTVGSASVPCLYLESMAYKFGVGSTDASQTATLKGDSLYYNPGSTYIDKAIGTNTANQVIVLAHPAYAVTEGGVQRRTLAITAGSLRLLFGSDYTESYGAISNGSAVTTVTILAAVPITSTIYVSYASSDLEAFPQSVHALVSGVSGTLTALAAAGATTLSLSSAPTAGNVIILDDVAGSVVTETVVVATVTGVGPYTVTLVSATVFAHASAATWAVYVPTVKPAAIRGRDLDIYIGPAVIGAANAAAARGTRRPGIQSATVDWKVTLQNDEEFGNYHYVSIGYDVPVVSGSVAFRAATVAALLKIVQDLSGVIDPLQSATATNSPLLDVQVVLKNPVDGRVLKRLWIPDARFSLPGYAGRVQQKLDVTGAFTSDQGNLLVLDS